MAKPWVGEVLDFWFGLAPEQWWKADPVLDDRCQHFLDLWKEQRRLPAELFLTDADTALAAVILFDQLPRNMFRGHAESFATDHLALAITKGAVERGLDQALQQPRRSFLYMPFQHSEKLEDQNQAMLLFTGLGDELLLSYARRHHDVIARFGRFPHRNAMLGRASRAEELAAGDVDPTRL